MNFEADYQTQGGCLRKHYLSHSPLPIYDISRKVSEPCEVDFILGKNFIITTHYKSIIPPARAGQNI